MRGEVDWQEIQLAILGTAVSLIYNRGTRMTNHYVVSQIHAMTKYY